MTSLRTRRFLSYALALAVVAVVGVVSLVLRADTALAAVVLGHVVTLASVALGAGAYHDTKVRVASVGGEPPAPGSAPGSAP